MSDASTLLTNARHKSVTKKRLTKLKGGLTTRYLYDKPLVEYLKEDEQPHFVLAARQTAPTFSGLNSPTWSGQALQGMAMHMITDQRWLMVAGMKGGDGDFSLPIEYITITDYSTGHSGHEIELLTPEHEISVPIGNMYDGDEVEAVVSHLREVDGLTEEELREQSADSNDKYPEGVQMVAEGKNGQVILFEDKIRITREDIGMMYKLHQLGKGEKEIRLDNITSVQLKKPSSFTKGYIQFGQSGYSESDDGAFDAVGDENSVLFTQTETEEFVELRDKIERSQKRNREHAAATDSANDPTEQLKNIKELYDNGVLSDDEFEEKKQGLLDKI